MSDDIYEVVEGEFNEESVFQQPRNPRTGGRLDAVFDLLRSARRRALLYHLYDAETAVHALEDVVEGVRQYEPPDAEGDGPPSRQAVRTSLVHAHFPRLAAVGALEYDPRRGEVRFHGHPPIEEWLERTRRLELR